MHLLLVGLNHRTAPIGVREQFAIPARDLAPALTRLRADFGVDEAVILSTCNRVELYVTSRNPSVTFPNLVNFLSHHSRLAPEAFRACLYSVTDRGAVEHLFRVTAGLDSMVLGESEVTAQVKQAYELAHTDGATGAVLNRLFQKALHNAKVVRSQTRIAEGQASIGSVVVKLARQLFGDRLPHCQMLLWGAGKAAEATARHLVKHGVSQLWIVSRTPSKAQDLASLCRAGWLSWEQAMTHLSHVDIAIVCTQAPHAVIDQADVEALLPQRGSRPLFIIDLAVPRNVALSLKRQRGVHLYDIDDLQVIAQATLAQRHDELARCDALMRRQVEHFVRWHTPVRHEEVIPCGSVESSVS